jgi:hypothetical protein
MGTRGSFSGVKAAGAWSWPLTFIWYRGSRNKWRYTSTPQYAFMEWCSVIAQGQLYLTFTLKIDWCDCVLVLKKHTGLVHTSQRYGNGVREVFLLERRKFQVAAVTNTGQDFTTFLHWGWGEHCWYNSTEQSPWEANNNSARQEIPYI